MVIISLELTRVNQDRNIFSLNVELMSTFLLYRGLVHHHHQNLKYSIAVSWGRLRTRRNVSRIRFVTAVSLAVRFQIEIMSSWNLTDTTAPQISSPTMNCSPSMARTRFSQHRELRPFLSLTIHFPPHLLASYSHIGFIPLSNRWKSE